MSVAPTACAAADTAAVIASGGPGDGPPVSADPELLPRLILEGDALYRRRLAIGGARACGCKPGNLNCLTAKEWIKNQLGVWQFNYERRDLRDKKLHPAAFPISLARRVIELFTHRGELVIDPFVGSGTTLVAAQDAERNALGFDLQESYIALCGNRLGLPPVVSSAAPAGAGGVGAAGRRGVAADTDEAGETAAHPSVEGRGVAAGETGAHPSSDGRGVGGAAGETGAHPSDGGPGVMRTMAAQQVAVQDDARVIPCYLPPGGVGLIFTSPPYANLLNRRRQNKSRRDRDNGQLGAVEQYSQDARDLGTMPLDDYAAAMGEIYAGLRPLLRPGGHCVINVPDMWWEDERITIHLSLIEALRQVGYEFRNTIIWDRTNIVNKIGIFGWPSNYITMGTTFEYILDFQRRPN